MRYVILSDIHGNLDAFKAVLDDVASRGGFDQIWCLGDIVGYGPEPKECIQLLRQYDHICVAGNHDWAAVGNVELSDFNPEAAAACLWTAQQLSLDDVAFLKALPLRLYCGDFTLVHGSPREPIWEYLLSIQSAKVNFNYFQTRFCLVGHSHVPLLFESSDARDEPLFHQLSSEAVIELGENRLIINPGGVGQPRDGDPRASYAIYDSDNGAIWHYRIPYDIAATQQKMMACGLPPPLAARLSYGW
jgi:predicted phosphodiesterase